MVNLFLLREKVHRKVMLVELPLRVLMLKNPLRLILSLNNLQVKWV